MHDLATGTQQLTTGGWYPVWSPDGTRIAYQKFHSYAKQEIQILALDSGEIERTGIQGIPKEWSRDGQHLLYVAGATIRKGPRPVMLLRLADGKAQQVYHDKGRLTQGKSPSLSPDGKYVTLSLRGKGGDICVQEGRLMPAAVSDGPEGVQVSR